MTMILSIIFSIWSLKIIEIKITEIIGLRAKFCIYTRQVHFENTFIFFPSKDCEFDGTAIKEYRAEEIIWII